MTDHLLPVVRHSRLKTSILTEPILSSSIKPARSTTGDLVGSGSDLFSEYYGETLLRGKDAPLANLNFKSNLSTRLSLDPIALSW